MPVEPRRLDQLPPIDPGTIAVVRNSLARLPADPIALTEEFYSQLFAMAPGTRSMFAADMSAQNERLLNALLAAVQALDEPATVEVHLRRWGAAHRRAHGVTDEMYVFVGHALVRSVSKLLGTVETSVGSAWIAVYEWMAAVMIDGADQAEAAQREARTARALYDPHAHRPAPPTVPVEVQPEHHGAHRYVPVEPYAPSGGYVRAEPLPVEGHPRAEPYVRRDPYAPADPAYARPEYVDLDQQPEHAPPGHAAPAHGQQGYGEQVYRPEVYRPQGYRPQGYGQGDAHEVPHVDVEPYAPAAKP